MRKARLAIRKVNVALDSPGYCFGTGRSLKLVCFPARSPLSVAALPWSLAPPGACAGYLAALPSTRAITNRDVFYVANPHQLPCQARRKVTDHGNNIVTIHRTSFLD